MIRLWVSTHCCLLHVILFGVNMLPMLHDCIFISFIYANLLFPQTFFFDHFGWDPWVFFNNNHAMILIMNAYFWQIFNIHKHTWPCIVMTFFNWVGNSECNVESLIRVLSFSYLASFSPPSFVLLTRLLWSYLTDTCNNNFVTSCGSV